MIGSRRPYLKTVLFTVTVENLENNDKTFAFQLKEKYSGEK